MKAKERRRFLLPLDFTVMTLDEKCSDKATLDLLPSAEELAAAFMNEPNLCYEAVRHYLHFRPDRWVELAGKYSDDYAMF